MGNKLSSWRNEFNNLTQVTGIREEEVCDYLNVSHSHIIGWRKRTPVKRQTLIGIGMAFKQDLEFINDWIVRYGNKRKLYAEDLQDDLVWIYLINSNTADRESGTNYYRLYDACRDAIMKTYFGIWNDSVEPSKDPVDIAGALNNVAFDPEFSGLKVFVIENIDSFRTAYSKPRKMLGTYIRVFLDVLSAANGGQRRPINSLRGYLDDSMINYVTGSEDVINVMDLKSKGMTAKLKPVPKLRKTHLALCLALGMTNNEINTYLDLMGYSTLDPDSEEDSHLIKALESWEAKHPEVAKFKRARILGEANVELSEEECFQAAREMLMMRSNLDYEYLKHGWKFPYMKE